VHYFEFGVLYTFGNAAVSKTTPVLIFTILITTACEKVIF